MKFKFKPTTTSIVASENTLLDFLLWQQGLPSTLVQDTEYEADTDLIVYLLMSGKSIDAGEGTYNWRT